MSKALRMAVPALAAAIGLAVFWYLAPRSASFGMFEGTGRPNVGRLAFSFVATLAVVVLGSIYRHLGQLTTSTIPDPRGFLSNILRSVDLWLGLVGAPIVYALLLQSTDGMSLPGLLLVALENGFCSLLVLRAFMGRAEVELRQGAVVGVPVDKP